MSGDMGRVGRVRSACWKGRICHIFERLFCPPLATTPLRSHLPAHTVYVRVFKAGPSLFQVTTWISSSPISARPYRGSRSGWIGTRRNRPTGRGGSTGTPIRKGGHGTTYCSQLGATILDFYLLAGGAKVKSLAAKHPVCYQPRPQAPSSVRRHRGGARRHLRGRHGDPQAALVCHLRQLRSRQAPAGRQT